MPKLLIIIFFMIFLIGCTRTTIDNECCTCLDCKECDVCCDCNNPYLNKK